MSLTAVSLTPERIAAWTAAPYATASSGLMPLLSSLPLKKSESSFWTRGILGRAPDQHHLVDRGLVELGVPEGLLDRLERASEQAGAELFESGPSDLGVKVDPFEERVDLERRSRRRRERPLRSF